MIFNTDEGLVEFDRIRFGVQRNYSSNGFEIYMKDRPHQGGVRSTVKFVDVIRDPVDPAVLPTGAPMIITEEEAQNLMDSLWEAGVKPSGGEGHTAHIRALNAHLLDFRKIAFKKLGID